MPLIQGSSRNAVSENIRRERSSGKGQRQAVAIALDVARRNRADGGQVANRTKKGDQDPLGAGIYKGMNPVYTRSLPPRERPGGDTVSVPAAADVSIAEKSRRAAGGRVHTGPIASAVGGRTDHHAMSVPNGAYVLPADHVSSLGQGNTQAGMAILNRMFSTGPYGVSLPKITRGRGAPPAPKPAKFAKGGAAGPVPIMAAGGEYVLSPEQVASIGGGDVERGHKILDAWVVSNRKKHVKTLKKLPGPAKD